MNNSTEQTKTLKKHVATIHSASHLTLLQRKIANALLYNAYAELLKKNEHKIHIADLCEQIGYASKDYKKVRQALIALLSTVIEWNLIDQGRLSTDGIWNASAIIADASIDGPICSYSYSNRMRELLYHPELYGKLSMQVQMRFKSSYGLALYENCIRYEGINQTPWFEMTIFRKLMGVEEGRYPIYRDFKRRVLDKAVEEVNIHAPIFVTLDIKRQGRAVIAFRFLIKHKHKETKSVLNITDKNDKVLDVADQLRQNFGFSSTHTKEILQVYSADYVVEKIQMIEDSRSFKQGKIGNLKQYLCKALEENYQQALSSQRRVYSMRQEKEKLTQYRETQQELSEEYRCYQDAFIIKCYDAQSGVKKQEIKKSFEQQIRNNMYYTIYCKEGITNPLVKDSFCNFFRKEYKKLTLGCMSFEAFCQQRSIEK